MPIAFRGGLLVTALCALSAFAAPRPHVVAFGAWRSVELVSESAPPREMKVRALIMDGRLREFTTGPLHDVTDRVFVVRRAFRVNDSLPGDAKKPQWIWRLGGWLSVDRATGRVVQLTLPAFDTEISEASWYRDYAAYCGASDDGGKRYMVIAQIGSRKPVLRKEFSGDSCPAPAWERKPARVTFTNGAEKTSFAVHARSAELQPDAGDEEGPQ
ncbi:MAG: hypothetical protein ACHP79_04380 [Terriglobales bacterium]